MRLERALSCWLVTGALALHLCRGQEPDECCIPLDASGEHEIAKAIQEQIGHHAHLEHEEAALTRKLVVHQAKDAEARHHKEATDDLLEAEQVEQKAEVLKRLVRKRKPQKITRAKEAEVDAEHELREEEEKAKHEEAEALLVAKVAESEKKKEVDHEKEKLQKLIEEEELLAEDLEKLEGHSPEQEALMQEAELAEEEARTLEDEANEAQQANTKEQEEEAGEMEQTPTAGEKSELTEETANQVEETRESPEEEEEEEGVSHEEADDENGLFLHMPRGARLTPKSPQHRPEHSFRRKARCN